MSQRLSNDETNPREPGFLDRMARRMLLRLVWLYQRCLSWLTGGQCRFVPSCSCYAEECLARGPLLPALALIVWRLLRCQPLCRAGFDPVPQWLGKGLRPITDPPSRRQGFQVESLGLGDKPESRPDR